MSPIRERKPLEPKLKWQTDVVDVLKEGHGSLVDADKVDGKHASEISDPNVTVVGDNVDLLKGALINPPTGKKITKNAFTWTAGGLVETIKYYDGAELLFTLTFTWNGDGTLKEVART